MARKVYTREFKIQAVQMMDTDGLSVTEVSRQFGVGQNCLRAWREAARLQGAAAFPGQDNPGPAAGEGLPAHSDRGSQYASDHHQSLLGRHGIACSKSGVGRCRDNAPAESSFASLRKELVHDEDHHTREEARASIFEYIETFYNRIRRHSTLSYVSPADFEASQPE